MVRAAVFALDIVKMQLALFTVIKVKSLSTGMVETRSVLVFRPVGVDPKVISLTVSEVTM
jgi:hypothetical protein